LQQVARAPAGHVEKTIVERQVDVSHKRWHRAEGLEDWRKQCGISRLGGDINNLAHRPLVLVAIPGPDGRRQILQADHAIDETMRFGWIVRRTQLEHELILGSKVDFLQMLAAREIPKVQTAAVTRA
jgi:hypothetical protein